MADRGKLQFDRFEPAAGAAAAMGVMACKNCGSLLQSSYFVVNGNIVCDKCRRAIESEWNRGGAAGRFGKALVLGVLATIACSLIWYAVLKATDSQWGILAVVVGLLIGGAIRKGSNGRGGWRYQTLAMFLTYTAIVSSYVPIILEGIRKQRAQTTQSALSTERTESAQQADATTAAAKKPGAVAVIAALLLLLGLLYATPFLAGLSNVLGIVIIGIALYEAWKLNRRTELRVSGPHQVSTSGALA